MDALAHDTGERPEETFWPLILRGVGLGLIFVPLTSASMAELKVTELAQGTGMFNLTRQLGGSLGIAIMATLLTRFTAQKKALLTEHITTMDPMSLGRLESITQGLIARGINPLVAKQQALFMLDRQVQAQASVLAFSRIYILSGVILLRVSSAAVLVQDREGAGVGGDGSLGERSWRTASRVKRGIWAIGRRNCTRRESDRSQRLNRSLRSDASRAHPASRLPFPSPPPRTHRPRRLDDVASNSRDDIVQMHDDADVIRNDPHALADRRTPRRS